VKRLPRPDGEPAIAAKGHSATAFATAMGSDHAVPPARQSDLNRGTIFERPALFCQSQHAFRADYAPYTNFDSRAAAEAPPLVKVLSSGAELCQPASVLAPGHDPEQLQPCRPAGCSAPSRPPRRHSEAGCRYSATPSPRGKPAGGLPVPRCVNSGQWLRLQLPIGAVNAGSWWSQAPG